MKDVIIVGEDPVTRQVIKKLLQDTCPGGFNIIREDPVRGSEVKKLTPNYNRLAATLPVILLADLDNSNCPVAEQTTWLDNQPRHPNFMFRFAVDEAESWLLADRSGFAAFLGIDVAKIPEASSLRRREPHNLEIRTQYKTSLYLMRELAMISPKTEIKRQLTPLDSTSKSSEYNSALLPFIDQYWNVQEALSNSYSLKKMVNRLQEWCVSTLN
ncbi:MAG: hypothetical protein IT260_08440 [Saprospiraceae bacterium]|nr:hypothetical protein [Saprospiraceae bacterium]